LTPQHPTHEGRQAGRRTYQEAVKKVLILLWEASDRNGEGVATKHIDVIVARGEAGSVFVEGLFSQLLQRSFNVDGVPEDDPRLDVIDQGFRSTENDASSL
jgi:hypothetical protein